MTVLMVLAVALAVAVPAALGLAAALALAARGRRLARALDESSALLAERDRALRAQVHRLGAVVATQAAVAASAHDPAVAMTVVARWAHDVQGADGTRVALLDGDDLVSRATTGLAPTTPAWVAVEDALSHVCVSSGQPVHCADTEVDDRVDAAAAREADVRSVVVVPVVTGQETVGVLRVLARAPRAFAEEDLDVLQVVAGLLGTALGQAREGDARQALMLERISAFEGLRSAHTELQRLNTSLTDELDERRRAGDDGLLDERVGELLSRIGHDLRTPLNAILGFGQLLELDDLTPDQRENVEQVMKAGRHLLELINEALDVARLRSGDLALSLEPVGVATAIDDALGLVRPLATSLEVTLPGEPPSGSDMFVLADAPRLKQVLGNLLANAVTYNRPGGLVRLHCALLPGRRVRVEVVDTGPGIPEEQLASLFVPTGTSGPDHAPGRERGVGLALAKRLAEAMGGSIGVFSRPGRGSTFWIELDVVRSSDVTRPPRNAPSADRVRSAEETSSGRHGST